MDTRLGNTRMGVLLCAACVLAGQAASADTTYVVDKVTITGSRTVPNEKLMGTIQEHAGSRVTRDDIVADRDAISKELENAHVGGSVSARITSKGTHVSVEFIVNDEGVQAPVVTHVAPTLNSELFDGNKALSSDKLRAASGLNPGDALSDAKIQAAQKAIQAAYNTAKLPLDVNITGNIAQNGSKVDLTWHITEKKGKAKRNTEDEGGQKLDQ